MQTDSKQKKARARIVVLIAVLVVIAFTMFGIYRAFMPHGQTGAKEIQVTVVHGDQSEKEFTYQTDAAYLGEVIMDEGLVEGTDGDYGLFILTVDGETADDAKQQWWCLTKGGERLNTGADKTPIADGDAFELTLTEGY